MPYKGAMSASTEQLEAFVYTKECGGFADEARKLGKHRPP